MIISFDIDNTLIPYGDDFETEHETARSKLFRAEKIRKGSIYLFNELEGRGHKIWIYTTSYRSKLNLYKTFLSYGIKPSKIINETINKSMLAQHKCYSSKNPRLFGIDIHIDDAKGVEIEGVRLGFKTIILEPNDINWTSTVLKGIEHAEKGES